MLQNLKIKKRPGVKLFQWGHSVPVGKHCYPFSRAQVSCLHLYASHSLSEILCCEALICVSLGPVTGRSFKGRCKAGMRSAMTLLWEGVCRGREHTEHSGCDASSNWQMEQATRPGEVGMGGSRCAGGRRELSSSG